MPRKRKVKEDQFQVELTKDVAGVPEKTTKDIDSPDTAQAIQKAKQGDPQKYDQVTITNKNMNKAGPKTAPVASTPQQAISQTQVESKKTRRRKIIDPNTFELTERYDNTRFNYDYGIVLPIGFKPFMKKMAGRNKDVVVTERMGRVRTVISSPSGMDHVVEKLIRAAKSKVTENKDKATTVINGIMGSMKK